ncbi:MAG: hypothetical protein IPK50_20690 [Fibrobacterota bacterium]|nr:hypothetical protein [Fibrobacterota bacterium]QQS04670.1 MAG: hypothetical protein IPK50_20690 [Fibrobacterota bacterium]
MKRSLSLFTLATALLCIPSLAVDIKLSGTVTDLSGKALPGAGVALVGTGTFTSTNATGAWSIPVATAGIVASPKSTAALVHGHLVVDGSRIRLRFDGADAVGRRSSGAKVPEEASKVVVAARSAATFVDTLLYSWNGRIRARVGISSLTAGELGAQLIDTSTGAVGSIIPWNGSITYGSLTDARDGQAYKTVQIGTQTWMAENLNVKVDSSWWYKNSADSGAKYGRLYQWAAALKLVDSCNLKICSTQVAKTHQQGICPSGWHVPSDAEWDTLATHVGGAATAGKKLKSTSGWGGYDNSTDTYGFRALPAGLRYYDGSVNYVGSRAYFWSSSEIDADYAWGRRLDAGGDDLYRHYYFKEYGFSVRCLKDGP